MEENSVDPISNSIVDAETEKPADVLLTTDGQRYLNQTRPWARFMSIMVFIGTAFMVLGGLALFLVGITGNLVTAGNNTFGQIPGGGFGVGLIYLVMAVLYVPPGIFLSRYASAIKALESTRTSQALDKALKYQKSFWRYVGILTVVCLVVTAAALAFSLAVVFFMFLNK